MSEGVARENAQKLISAVELSRQRNASWARLLGSGEGRQRLEELEALLIGQPTYRERANQEGPTEDALYMAFREGQNSLVRQIRKAVTRGQAGE